MVNLKAENTFDCQLSIAGWQKGNDPNLPSGLSARFDVNNITYRYYSDQACTQQIAQPTSETAAGTYYVKGYSAATANYNSVGSTAKQFEISVEPDYLCFRSSPGSEMSVNMETYSCDYYGPNIVYSYDKKNWNVLSCYLRDDNHVYWTETLYGRKISVFHTYELSNTIVLNDQNPVVYLSGIQTYTPWIQYVAEVNDYGAIRIEQNKMYFRMDGDGTISAGGCLSTIPAIDYNGAAAIGLGDCFSLFEGCDKLTHGPKAAQKYIAGQFEGDVSWCILYQMYLGCTQLTGVDDIHITETDFTAPEYYAQYYDLSTCYQMFRFCDKLKELHFVNMTSAFVKDYVVSSLAVDNTENLSIYCSDGMFVHNIVHNVPDYLNFSLADDSTSQSILLTKHSSPDPVNLEYSYDKVNWTPWTDYDISAIHLTTSNPTVYLRAGEGGNVRFGKDSSNYHTFKFTEEGHVNAAGNIQSLLDQTCQQLSVPEFCYTYMFCNCASLTTAPALPATTLASSCYYRMFLECDKFTECHMKESVATTYSTATHGDTTKQVIFDLK